MTYILAIDQGTTSSRAIIFDTEMTIKATAQEEFEQHYPKSGWVEHDPSDLWSTVASTCRGAIERARFGRGAAAIGAATTACLLRPRHVRGCFCAIEHLGGPRHAGIALCDA